MNINMLLKDGKKKALTFSYDDGKISDIKLAGLLDKYKLKGTFNINSGRLQKENFADEKNKEIMTVSQVKNLFENFSHEIACHGLSHADLECLRYSDVLSEILQNRNQLEQISGRIVRGMAYPFCLRSDEVMNAARSAGILYARTSESSGYFNIPDNFLKFNPTCSHNDSNLMKLAEIFVNRQPSWGSCWLFSVWGHSNEFEVKNNWDLIEKFAGYVCCKDDIWYVTNIEFFEYIKAFHMLESTLDNHIVRNVCSTTLWFEANGKTYKAKPDEVVYIK